MSQAPRYSYLRETIVHLGLDATGPAEDALALLDEREVPPPDAESAAVLLAAAAAVRLPAALPLDEPAVAAFLARTHRQQPFLLRDACYGLCRPDRCYSGNGRRARLVVSPRRPPGSSAATLAQLPRACGTRCGI